MTWMQAQAMPDIVHEHVSVLSWQLGPGTIWTRRGSSGDVPATSRTYPVYAGWTPLLRIAR